MKNFIQFTWRRFLKDKAFTTLNLLGLSLGVSFVVIIFLLISYLTGFDKHHKFTDRIYRVNTQTLQNDQYHYSSGVPVPLGPRMLSEVPEVDMLTSVFYEVGGLISVEEEDGSLSRYNEPSGIAYVDTMFYKIFTRKVLEGDLVSTLGKPDFVAISREMATKYFGEHDALGRTLNLNNSLDLIVGAILEDYGDNTHFPFNVLISSETYRRINAKDLDNWNSNASDYQTYILLKEKANQYAVEEKLESIAATYHADRPENTLRYYLQPLADLHFDERTSNYLYKSAPKSSILTSATIGLLLLLTACINFINMSTAQAIKRSKEVGIRKILGGSKSGLVFRYIGETSLLCLMAVIAGLGFAELFLIKINELLELDLHINQEWLSLLMFLITTWVLMSILAGLYPAMMLSNYSPIKALRSSMTKGKGTALNLRRGLVIFQFFISQFLFIGAIIIMAQTSFLKNAPMGFDKNMVVLTRLPEQDAGKLEVLRNGLLSKSNVENVSYGLAPPASGTVWGTNMEFGGEDISIHVKMTDSAYLSTYAIKLKAGRFLGNSDTARNIVINEKLAQMLTEGDLENLLGRNVRMWGMVLPIVGIVEDFHATSLTQPIKPLVFTNFTNRYYVAGIKINPGNISETLTEIEEEWTAVFPQYIFDYNFLDDSIARFYQGQQKLSDVLLLFVIVTLVIGCLGLYGLVSFMVNNRIKEVGIRKALGATTGQVVKIFANEFVALVVIAFIVASPLGYFLMDNYLSQFAYKIDIQTWMFALTLVVVLGITFMTVGYKSLRAAQANPVDALRNE